MIIKNKPFTCLEYMQSKRIHIFKVFLMILIMAAMLILAMVNERTKPEAKVTVDDAPKYFEIIDGEDIDGSLIQENVVVKGE